MNEFQYKLWQDLMNLVNDSEAFYYADQSYERQWYRIFNYRLASYTEFLKPNALECRGHMFRITEEGENARPLWLAALPMQKFFNLNENPMTTDLDLTTVNGIWDKIDGSLISTYLSDSGSLLLKTKGSLSSDQAVAAMTWLSTPRHQGLHDNLRSMNGSGYTVNMEWIAPENRIVIGYQEAALRILNVRSMTDGHYLDHESAFNMFPHYMVEEVRVNNPITFVSSIPEMDGIEGYVLRLKNKQYIKIKTNWYLALHHTKDNINSPRRLFEAVLEEATDDMRTLFADDPLAIQTIENMEEFVGEKFNHMVDTVERFYERNKHMERKDYAILGQKEFAGTFYFSLAMSRYLGKTVNYKEFLKSKWKQLGLKDGEK